jgi:hypothetical protein
MHIFVHITVMQYLSHLVVHMTGGDLQRFFLPYPVTMLMFVFCSHPSGDGWLSWLGDGWLSWYGRWVAKLVYSAPPRYGSSLGLNPDISQKYKMGDMSKGVAYTLWPAKNIQKKCILYKKNRADDVHISICIYTTRRVPLLLSSLLPLGECASSTGCRTEI